MLHEIWFKASKLSQILESIFVIVSYEKFLINSHLEFIISSSRTSPPTLYNLKFNSQFSITYYTIIGFHLYVRLSDAYK